ncbi:MAG TPA: hypothetical protein VGD37_27105, partial [Kofleriaceae bacterium]
MLGSAQADPARSELAGLSGVIGCVGIGAHAEAAELIAPLKDVFEAFIELGLNQLGIGLDHR